LILIYNQKYYYATNASFLNKL